MTLYGYIAPVAERVAGFNASDLTWVLVIVGLGLVIGNMLGGRTADANLRLSLILWPAAMIMSLIVVGFVAPFKWLFPVAAFVFGIASFANVPPMQMRVMKYGKAAPELAATANISAFNVANALGGLIGGPSSTPRSERAPSRLQPPSCRWSRFSSSYHRSVAAAYVRTHNGLRMCMTWLHEVSLRCVKCGSWPQKAPPAQ
jgi:MFS family permease